MKYIGIVWNPTYNYSNEIKKIIRKYGKVTNSIVLDLSDDYFKDFIDKLYNYPKEEKWKSEYKINDLMAYKNKIISIFEIEIEDNELIKNNKNKIVQKKAQELKDYIRNNYNYTEINGIKKEIYLENSFHLTDNEEEYQHQKEVIEKFRSINYVDDYESAKYYDALPRFSKNVYNYLKKIGLYNKIVADVGCGTGRITVDLLENKNKVFAIDPDSNMLTVCKKKCNKYDNFIPIIGTEANMNIPSKSVDYVLVSQSYHRFNPVLFKNECYRVLKNKEGIIIIWYRVNFKDRIISKMLSSAKKNFKNYKTRYGNISEIEGSKLEELENNKEAKKLLGTNAKMKELTSKSEMTEEEFLNLGLSLVLLPTTHEMNTVTKLFKSDMFNREEYINDLKNIFNEYSIDDKIELKLKVQIHHC